MRHRPQRGCARWIGGRWRKTTAALPRRRWMMLTPRSHPSPRCAHREMGTPHAMMYGRAETRAPQPGESICMTDQPILNPQGKGTFWYVPQSTALMAALAAEAKAAGLDPDKVAWGPYLQARLYAWYNLGAVPFSGKTSPGSGEARSEEHTSELPSQSKLVFPLLL